TNRFEGLLRQINPLLSLHYWDFKEDPSSLFDANFMGSPAGSAGDPWLTAGFYDPQAGQPDQPGQPHHLDDRDSPNNRDHTPHNPCDSVTDIPRNVGQFPAFDNANLESTILALGDYPTFRSSDFNADNTPKGLEGLHDLAHVYFANVSPHLAFRDPFVYLL